MRHKRFLGKSPSTNHLIKNDAYLLSAMQKGNPRVPIMKENISNLRKLISDDYKEREIFLDTHCRPSSGSTNSQLRDDPTKKKRSAFVSSSSSVTSAAATVVPGGTMAGSRKHALLAALKVIDNDKDQD